MGTLVPVPDDFGWMEQVDLLYDCTETDLGSLNAQVMPVVGMDDVSTPKKTMRKKHSSKDAISTLRVYDALSTAATTKRFKNRISAQKSRDRHKKQLELLQTTIAVQGQAIEAMKQEVITLSGRLNALTCQ